MLDAAITLALDANTPSDHQGCYGNASPWRVGWIVAVTHPQAERWANTNLQQNGYQTYLPLIAARRRDRAIPSLTHRVLVPAFPGYLFVHYDSRDPRRPIRETPGVRDVIRCGSQIQWAPDAAISALQAAEAERASYHQPSHKLAPGAAVAVSRGALAGWPAVITNVSRDTAQIAVMMFGALREISVAVDCLTARDE